MNQIPAILSLFVLLLMPAYAQAQTPDRITLLDNFGSYDRGEPLFVYGQIANLADDSFLIMQIHNPDGNLCQIQQLSPLTNGAFITDVIPLKGRVCGLVGQYEITLFYGDYTKSTTFSVSSDAFSKPGSDQMISSAQQILADQGETIGRLFDVPSPAPTPSSNISELESSYVRLWSEFFVDDLIIEIDPLIRPAVSSSLDSVQKMLDDAKLSPEIAKSIKEKIFAAIFYYEIEDKTKSIDILSDVFVYIQNVTPEKATQRTPTFDELEETLLNLMKKSDTVMSKSVKNQIGFIFARGTAPLYSDDLSSLIDILSKSRYLDVMSRKQSDLYRLVQSEWESLKPSLMGKESIEKLISSSVRVSELHQASILLRELDDVDRFVSSDSEENGALANLILPDWRTLKSNLALATSVEDILESESEINQMAQIIDISSRISKIVEISQSNGIDSALVGNWEILLDKVRDADSADDVLEIVSEFDQSITELREKRNPLVVLEFQYRTLKEKAELQADYQNLVTINNALKILSTAKQMESGSPTAVRIDRIEVLLSWASDLYPKIKQDLDSYTKDVYKIRASDILQRAQSLEGLVGLSMTKNRFLPNYIEFTEKLNEKIDDVRDLVIKNDLDQANLMVRDLFDEWTLVSQAYANDPLGSDVGYSVDELKRIEFRKKLDTFENTVSNFYNAGFTSHATEYNQKMADAYELIDLANFVDAESKITEIGDYLSDHLVLSSPSIIFDIHFDAQSDMWVINGATKKSTFAERENLYVTIYNMDGSRHSSLEFTDTKQGNFFTRWVAPTEPGLYVVMLQYKDSKASQIVHIEEEFGYKYNASDLGLVELAREFEELESFAEKFGGSNFNQNSRFAAVTTALEVGFRDKDAQGISENLEELRIIIERYLPARSPVAVIEAVYDNGKLTVSGAVQKSLAFREDLFVDVYDQRGTLVEEIALKDNSSGLFTETINHSFASGVYVAKLQYHNLAVTDFFNVR